MQPRRSQINIDSGQLARDGRVAVVTISRRVEMDSIIKVDAESVVRRIEDRTSPFAAEEALALRDKWLFENDLGALQISQEVRAILEAARITPQ